MAENKQHFTYIVVGGGIAGVTCAETLSSLCPGEDILLLTASPLIKAVTNFKKVSRALEEFDVEERPMCDLQASCPNVKVTQDAVTNLQADKRELTTKHGKTYSYSKLCICSGGTPKVIAKDNPYVLGIRDTETIKVFQERLCNARRVVLVGNGGIATELAYEIQGCQVVWAVKDSSITSTFVDAGAAHFFLPQLAKDKQPKQGPVKRLKYTVGDDVGSSSRHDTLGSALGPDWSKGMDMQGVQNESHNVHVEYKVEIKHLHTKQEATSLNLKCEEFPSKSTSSSQEDSWPVYTELTNGKVYGCDFVISATGVIPNTTPFTHNNKLESSEDGGLKVGSDMKTTMEHVYAAGDVCTANWEPAPHWIQMRLWSQARQMGHYAAKCMCAAEKGEAVAMDFCFELFAHMTRFFNYKVILLGKFNGQGLGGSYELLLRTTPGLEYVKTVMKDGRMHGAILIGETDLEETFENLILNQMDLSVYGEDLLDPNIDIEDYFD